MRTPTDLRPAWSRAFSLIELLVVMAIVGTLLSIVAPRYFSHLDRAKEVVLRTNLATIRDAIDKYHADKGRYPESLSLLTAERYLRELPVDPMTERADTWLAVPPPGTAEALVHDVRSGSAGVGSDGRRFTEW